MIPWREGGGFKGMWKYLAFFQWDLIAFQGSQYP